MGQLGKNALLDLLFLDRGGLMGDAMVGSRLGYGDHERVDFQCNVKNGQQSCYPGLQESKI